MTCYNAANAMNAMNATNAKAIVLLSGGMDSAVTLFLARKSYECTALIFNYGQKASKEIACAKMISKRSGSSAKVMKISFPWKGSSLVDSSVDVPEGRVSPDGEIPNTYVPARNIVFLSFGIAFAEATGAEAVFIGAHQLDFSNYPDCRSEFFDDFRRVVRSGTRKGSMGQAVRIETPIINMTKAEIVKTGAGLGVPFEYTWSCYRDGAKPCGTCESCLLRGKAFNEAGVCDPAGGYDV